MLPKAGFAAMLGFKGCNISLMRLKRAEIADRCNQAFAFGGGGRQILVSVAIPGANVALHDLGGSCK